MRTYSYIESVCRKGALHILEQGAIPRPVNSLGMVCDSNQTAPRVDRIPRSTVSVGDGLVAVGQLY